MHKPSNIKWTLYFALFLFRHKLVFCCEVKNSAYELLVLFITKPLRIVLCRLRQETELKAHIELKQTTEREPRSSLHSTCCPNQQWRISRVLNWLFSLSLSRRSFNDRDFSVSTDTGAALLHYQRSYLCSPLCTQDTACCKLSPLLFLLAMWTETICSFRSFFCIGTFLNRFC